MIRKFKKLSSILCCLIIILSFLFFFSFNISAKKDSIPKSDIYNITGDINVKISDPLKIDEIQFTIIILIILFSIFLWLGYIIPSLEGKNRSFHYIPFSGGMFIMFSAIDFISLSILLTTNYPVGMIGGFLVTIGIILLLYGVLKAFYYE